MLSFRIHVSVAFSCHWLISPLIAHSLSEKYCAEMFGYCFTSILGPPVATRERTYSFAAVFFFSARCPRSLGRSPWNFTTWSEMGAILKTKSKIWGSFPKKNLWPKNMLFPARLPTTSHFDHEYLRCGTKYRQSENGLQTTISPASADAIWWTLVYKRRKTGL